MTKDEHTMHVNNHLYIVCTYHTHPFLQYIPLGNTHQCNTSTGELRIHIISSSTEGLPYLSLVDHHCPCFLRRFKLTMEIVCTTDGKTTATTKLSTTETTSSQLPTLSITGRTGKCGQHLYIIQTTHPQSNSTTAKRSLFQCYVKFH